MKFTYMEYTPLFKPPHTQTLKSGKVKLLPGEEVGEHVTENKEEMIIVLKGAATIYAEDKKIEVSERSCYFIKEDTKHNVKNHTEEILEYVFVVNSFA